MGARHHPASKTLETASALANLLPTGTVLSMEALIPTITNNGMCLRAHRYLSGITIGLNALLCFFSAFTDSFETSDRIYYGYATPGGLKLFGVSRENDLSPEELNKLRLERETYKLHIRDFFHAFMGLLVFLCFAFSDSNVQRCYFYHADKEENAVVTTLPLLASVFAGFFFAIWPTRRRGIGTAAFTGIAGGGKTEILKPEEPKPSHHKNQA